MRKNAKESSTNQGSIGLLAQLALPLAQLIRGDLRDMVLGLGLQAIQVMFEQERTAVCGPRYRHDHRRRASRGGHVTSPVEFGGREINMRRPRVVDTTGAEVPLQAWDFIKRADPMTERVLEQMVLGVATRNYARSLEPLPEGVADRGTSRSSVSRRFVAATRKQLAEALKGDLGALDLVVVFIDGLHFHDHVVLCALGVDAAGHKHVLGLAEGAAENAAASHALLEDLVSRGMKPDRRRLFVIDGSKALHRAVRDVFGRQALVQRCQVHKMANVVAHVPKKLQASIRAAIREAYRSAKVETAKRLLNNLARRLEVDHPGAAASLREGLDETLTVMSLALPRTLERSFSTTNAVESLNDRIRAVGRRVKRWRGGEMILRWTSAAVIEAARGFRRIKGYVHMPRLLQALGSDENQLVDSKKRAA